MGDRWGNRPRYRLPLKEEEPTDQIVPSLRLLLVVKHGGVWWREWIAVEKMLRWFSGVQESKDNLRHEARFLHFVNLFLELFIARP